MKNPFDNHDHQDIHEMCKFAIDFLKKGLAHAPARQYILQNKTREFIKELDAYISFLDFKKNGDKK